MVSSTEGSFYNFFRLKQITKKNIVRIGKNEYYTYPPVEPTYTCTRCGYSSNHFEEHLTHMRDRHKSRRNYFICSICEKTFSEIDKRLNGQEGLYKHLANECGNKADLVMPISYLLCI